MDVKDLAQWLGERLDRLEGKVDDVQANVTKNTVDLAHHIARTDALETRVEQVDHDARTKDVVRGGELKPLQDFHSRAKGAAALLALVATALAVIHYLRA